jgi:hypothetical protein
MSIFPLSMSRTASIEGDPLTLDDFRRAGTATDDRRREPRVPSDKAVAIRPCRPSEDRGFRPARLRDCSVHGLGLFADEPMDPGEQFMVRLQLERVVLAVYTVRHCRRAAGQYIVGAALSGFIGGSDDPNSEAIIAALTSAESGRAEPDEKV